MNPARLHSPSTAARGMTLMELLLAMAIFSVVMLAIMTSVNTLQNMWVRMRANADAYRGARLALDAVARKLSQATVIPRYEAPREGENEPGDDASLPFVRRSDHHLICGPAQDIAKVAMPSGHALFFVGPFNEIANPQAQTAPEDREHGTLHELLSAWGYYVQLQDATKAPPKFLAQDAVVQPDNVLTGVRQRFRLMEMRQSADELMLLRDSPNSRLGAPDASEPWRWFQDPLIRNQPGKPRVRVVADNILALIVIPLTGSDATGPINASSTSTMWDTRDTSDAAQRHRHAAAYRLTVIATPEDYWHRPKVVSPTELQSQINGLFTAPNRYAKDLEIITTKLTAKGVPHRVLSTIVRPASS